jgi:uncharacterized membrane protein YbhN (UPF0104 family)
LALVRRYALFFMLLIMGGLVVALGIEVRDITNTLSRLALWQLGLLLLVNLAICLNLALKNTVLLYLAGHRVRFSRMALYFFSSAVAHYTIPGKAGYPVTAWLLRRFDQVPLGVSASVLTWDFALSFSFTAALALTGALVFLPDYSELVLLAGALFLGGVLLALGLAYGLARRLGRSNRLVVFLRRTFNLMGSYRASRFSPLLIFYVSNALLSGGALWLLIVFVGGSVDLGRLVTADAVSFILGALTMVPLGLGLEDLTLLFFLSSFGLEQADGLAVILLRRTLYMGLVYGLGLLANLILGLLDLKGDRGRR